MPGVPLKLMLFSVLVATVTAATTAIATVAASATTAAVTAAVSATASASAVAATITTATAAAATETAAVSTGSAFCARTSLVHHQVPAMEGLPVGTLDTCFASGIVGHFHETEATATVGGFVHDDLGRGHFTESFEKFAEILVLRGVRDVGDINVHEYD